MKSEIIIQVILFIVKLKRDFSHKLKFPIFLKI